MASESVPQIKMCHEYDIYSNLVTAESHTHVFLPKESILQMSELYGIIGQVSTCQDPERRISTGCHVM
jgi:hypothetical protein